MTRQSYLDRMEHVPAEPFARLLRTLIERKVQIETAHPRCQVVTSGTITQEDYAERFGTSTRTAERHFAMVLDGEQIPVVIADRIAALAGLPLAYVEATG